MPTPKTLEQFYKSRGMNEAPSKIEVITMSRLRELVRQAWNYGVAAERDRKKEHAQ